MATIAMKYEPKISQNWVIYEMFDTLEKMFIHGVPFRKDITMLSYARKHSMRKKAFVF